MKLNASMNLPWLHPLELDGVYLCKQEPNNPALSAGVSVTPEVSELQVPSFQASQAIYLEMNWDSGMGSQDNKARSPIVVVKGIGAEAKQNGVLVQSQAWKPTG